MIRWQILGEAMHAFAEASAEPQQLFATIARKIAEGLGAFCGFTLVSADGMRLEPVVAFDPDPAVREILMELASRAPLPLDSPHPIARAMATGTTTQLDITPELLRSRFPRPEDLEVARALDLKRMLAVPLRARGRLVGGLILVRRGQEARPFDDDIQLAQNLADHAALAVSNAQQLVQSQQLANRLKLFSELAQQFAGCVTDYGALLALVARRLGEVLGDGCSIRMIEDDQLETPGAVYHPDAEILGYLEDSLRAQPQQLGEGVSGRVALTGETALIPHVDLDQIERALGRRYREIIGRVGAKSILVVALRANDAIIGACAMYRTKSNVPYSEEDRYLLEDLATHAGLAIANSRLLDDSKRARVRREELEERTQRMQEASRLKSEFLANMSHELRTPLNAVIGFAALMHAGKAGPMSDTHKEYVGDILGSARHLLQLINDVLDLAKIESGRHEIRVETVDLAKLAAEVRDIVRGLAAEKTIAIAIEHDRSIGPVRVDPRLLKQTLYNYLSNAIKFTPESGRVTLRIKQEGDDRFCVEVEDTGIGIKPEDLDRLFVEFQQLEQGTTKRYSGTGLGLALTKRIVEAQGGHVAVRSTVGTGSTFSAVLPRNVKTS